MKRDYRNAVSFKKYVAGWFDNSLRDFLGNFPRVPSSMHYALVTVLDSNLEPSFLLETSPCSNR